MAHDTGSLTAGDRLDALEEIHDPDGSCARNRSKFWEEIGKLNDRLTRMEVKLMMAVAISNIVVTIIVQVGIAVWQGHSR